jgi:hypothetical protein
VEVNSTSASSMARVSWERIATQIQERLRTGGKGVLPSSQQVPTVQDVAKKAAAAAAHKSSSVVYIQKDGRLQVQQLARPQHINLLA